MAVEAMIFNMVAELPGSDPLGEMKLPEVERVVIAMASLVLASVLAFLARDLVKEIMKVEYRKETAMEEDELPKLYYAPSGERTHARRDCYGLRNSMIVNDTTPCRVCCSDRMFLLERRRHEEGATFVQAAGRWLWLKVFLAGVLLATSFTVIFVVNDRDGISIVKYAKEIASVEVKPAGMNRKMIASVEVEPVGKNQDETQSGVDYVRKETEEESDQMELASWFSILRSPNTQFKKQFESGFLEHYYTIVDSMEYKNAGKREIKNVKLGMNEEVPHLKNNDIFEYVKYLAVNAGRSLEPVTSYVVRTCHHLCILLGTPIGMVTWISLYFWAKVKQKKREKKEKKLSRRESRRAVHVCLQSKKLRLYLVLLYTHMQCAVAMEEALRQLTEITTNSQQIQQLAQAMSSQQTQAGTATQQLQELANAMGQQRQIMQEASAATNQALAQQAELTANAVAATAKLTSEAVENIAHRAESRRPGDVELHKLIKAPEVFGPSTYKEERDGFLEFRTKMRSWIGALDNEILEKMNEIEKDREAAQDMEDYTEEGKAQARKLHSILTSYTKGRPLRTIKQVASENGFEAWRMLVEEHQPHTRARSLQLLNSVLNHKFDAKKSTQENLLKFEEMIEQYERASGSIMDDDLKVSVVLGGTDGAVRQHLLLNQKETSKYGTLRQYLLSYEQATRWTTTDLINSGRDHQGQADMDISRIEDKGKGKYKGKGKWSHKGKGKQFGGYKGKFGGKKGRGEGEFQYYRKGRGRGFKGRGKKGRGWSKGRGKGYNKGGKGKGHGAGVCHYCQKPGHFEAQCRLKQKDMQMGTVRQAQEDDFQSVRTQSTTLPSASSTATSSNSRNTAATNRATVRQISMFHIGEEPENFPEVFDLDENEDEIEISYFGGILRVAEVEEYFIGEEDQESEDEDDELMRWYSEDRKEPQEEVHFVRAVEEIYEGSPLHERIEVILDSGADASLVPMWLSKEGLMMKSKRTTLQDAQGKSIITDGQRMPNLTFCGRDGEVTKVQESFTVASVLNPLIAIGKLFRAGWEIKNEEQGLTLTDGEVCIPVHYHKNSLAAYAYVQTPSKIYKRMSNDICVIRTIMQLNSHLQGAIDKQEPGWHDTDSLVIVKHSERQKRFENPSFVYSARSFPFRSTLVKEEEGWKVIEVSKKYNQKMDPFEEFEGGEYETVTAISTKPIPIWLLGTPVSPEERAEEESNSNDYWKIDKGELVRYHMTPRTVLFYPIGVKKCPVEFSDIEEERHTYGECVYATETYEKDDNWFTDFFPT